MLRYLSFRKLTSDVGPFQHVSFKGDHHTSEVIGTDLTSDWDIDGR